MEIVSIIMLILVNGLLMNVWAEQRRHNRSKVTLTEEESHLVASGGPVNAAVPQPTWSEFFTAKRDFQMGSTTGRAVTMYCTGQQGRVRIRRVEVIDR